MKLFKNRIIQEDEKTIRKMKSLFVDMNTDKQMTPNTPYGLFALAFLSTYLSIPFRTLFISATH